MELLNSIDLEALTGIRADIYILALAVLVLVLIIVMIINGVRNRKMKKAYRAFMEGRDGESLEDNLMRCIVQVEKVAKNEEKQNEDIATVLDHLDRTYQKIGLVKYNAFDDMGGKLSFSLAMLNRKNDGFVLNAMHSREGCFTYIKEVINGNTIIVLSEEEKEALEMALHDNA